jgi:hypothetical protein
MRLPRVWLSRQRVAVMHGLLARVGLAAGAAGRPAAGLLAFHARRHRARPRLARDARVARRRLRVALRHTGAMRARTRAMLLGRGRRWLPGCYRGRVTLLPGVLLLPARIGHARRSHGTADWVRLRLPRRLPARLVLGWLGLSLLALLLLVPGPALLRLSRNLLLLALRLALLLRALASLQPLLLLACLLEPCLLRPHLMLAGLVLARRRGPGLLRAGVLLAAAAVRCRAWHPGRQGGLPVQGRLGRPLVLGHHRRGVDRWRRGR